MHGYSFKEEEKSVCVFIVILLHYEYGYSKRGILSGTVTLIFTLTYRKSLISYPLTYSYYKCLVTGKPGHSLV